ncbi:MAG: 30S ribosome-binding factor RbfA [Chitinophagaceae bacterium]|nr:30S ribosome-binding factor RbfA [Chitinophagaceae bacterium]
MTEGKRQKQVAAEITKELNDIFLKMQLNMQGGGMVSISTVKMTPDLYEARIYLSLFRVSDENEVLNKFKTHSSEIRGELGKRMRHQLRIIPQLVFYKDDTLDHVFRIEQILDDIKKQDGHNKDS